MRRAGSSPSSGSSRSGASASDALAGPAADHLGAQQLLFGRRSGLGAEVLAVRGHPRVQLAEDQVGAVAAQHLGLRHRGQLIHLVPVAQEELARFDGRLLGVGAGEAAALDRGVADAVSEAERGALSGQGVDVLAPDRFDAVQFAVGGASALEDRLEPLRVGREGGERDVDIGCSERRLPVLRRALADIAQEFRPRCHALLELLREAVERGLRDSEGLEALERGSRADPRLLVTTRRVGGGGECRQQPSQQLPACLRLVDAEQDVDPDVRRRPGVQRAVLDVRQLECAQLCGHVKTPYRLVHPLLVHGHRRGTEA